MKHIKNYKLIEQIDNIEDKYQKIQEEIYNIIANNHAQHEDDYPDCKQTAKECMEIIKQHI